MIMLIIPLLLQAITLSSSAREQLVIDDEAIRKLSQIFDIPNLKNARTTAHAPHHLDTFMALQDNITTNNKDDMQDSPLSYSEWKQSRPEERMMADDHQQKGLPQPPPYMINLFNTIADRDGVMRLPNPYHANLIKSFPNKDLVSEGGLHFDLTSVHSRETILQAELHLELLPLLTAHPLGGANEIHRSMETKVMPKTSVPVEREKEEDGEDVFVEMYLIERAFPLRKRLIAKRRLSRPTAGGGNFTDLITIRPAVVDWINRPHHNYGLQISISSTVRNEAGEIINYRINKGSDQGPVLILFMDDGRPDRNPKYRIKSSAKQNEYLKNRLTRLGQVDLYQSYSSADQLDASLPIRPSASQHLDAQDIFRIFPLSSSSSSTVRVKRSKKSSPRKNKRRQEVSVKKYRRGPNSSKGPRGSCRRHELYVSFEEIGWSSWIISPKGFQAFHCRGDCHFPIGQESKPSNHATVISIINHLKLHNNVGAACCVPEKLYSISLLYFDNEQNVILKQYDDMVAQSCACR
ncbi:putative Univin [Hypsibius exemplaris]|uniref:Univin n=1 Tax=Hypsibius exemplaris TaxID=2072580 RepID=A0A1W0WFK1_HYPEX|nr:putative Univin [Hypsibius exemplaris]